MDHPSGTHLHSNWASNDSSSDNSFVYKYEKIDGSAIQTGCLDNSSSSTNYPDSSSGRMICLFARIYTQTNYQTNYRCLPIRMQVRPRGMIHLKYNSGHSLNVCVVSRVMFFHLSKRDFGTCLNKYDFRPTT